MFDVVLITIIKKFQTASSFLCLIPSLLLRPHTTNKMHVFAKTNKHQYVYIGLMMSYLMCRMSWLLGKEFGI